MFKNASRVFDVGRERLKILAILTMTIDHIGVVIYPDQAILRVIGRISFPLFAYLAVLGMESTSNLRNYLMRLLIFALISQIPFFLAAGIGPFDTLNIFFTLFSGVLFLSLLKSPSTEANLVAAVPVLASVLLNFDYGAYGIASISCMYILRKNIKYGIVALLLLNGVFFFLLQTQIFSLLALPLILLHDTDFSLERKRLVSRKIYPRWRKYLFYVYYPLHLTVLYLVKIVIT